MLAVVDAVINKLFPYLIALIVGAGLGMWVRGIDADRALLKEKAAHQSDVAAFQKEMSSISADAALAQAKALTDHQAQEGKIATLDDQLTKEKTAHENDARTYAAALATGDRRLRIAVTSCSARRDDVPAAASAASVDDGGPAYADIAPAAAERLVNYAADDQREIDKLNACQAYVAAIQH